MFKKIANKQKKKIFVKVKKKKYLKRIAHYPNHSKYF